MVSYSVVSHVVSMERTEGTILWGPSCQHDGVEIPAFEFFIWVDFVISFLF